MSVFFVYLPMGLLLVSTNLLVLLTILRHSQLRIRKEYTIIGALSLADTLAGTGHLLAFVYRASLPEQNLELNLTSRVDCFFKPHNLVYGHSTLLQPFMLAVISIDRYLAVTRPLEYYGYTRKYAFGLLGLAYALAYGSQLLGFFLVRSSTHPEVSVQCFTIDSVPEFYFKLTFLYHMVASSFSVIFYVAVFAIFKKKQAAQVGIAFGGGEQEAELKLWTKSMQYSSIFTFLFCVLPTICMLIVPQIGKGPIFNQIGGFCYMLSQLNPVFNIFILLKRHKNFRQGLVAFLKCRKMTQQNAVLPAPARSRKANQNKGLEVESRV